MKFRYTTLLCLVLWAAACGSSTDSDSTATTTTTAAPDTPTGLVATSGNAKVTLSWTAVSSATSYTLYYSTSTGVTPDNGTAISGITDSSYLHTGLINRTTYYYILTASNAGGTSAPTSEASAAPGLPSVPSHFSVSAGNAKNTLSWTAVSDATGYTLYWDTVTGVSTSSQNKITISDGTTSSYSHTNLTNNTSYYYLITATDARGEGPVSSEISAVPRAVSKMFLFAADSDGSTSTLRPFSINLSTGALTVGIDTTLSGVSLITLIISPSGQFLAALSSNAIYPYSIDQTTGNLTAQTSVSLSNLADVAFLPNDIFAHVSNGSSIIRYTLSSAGAFSSATTVVNSGLNNAGKIRVDPSGGYLYVYDMGNNRVVPYTVASNGTLTAGTAVTTSANGNGLTMTRTGSFLYALNTTTIVPISISNGALISGTSVSTGGGNTDLIMVDGNGLFLYERDTNNNFYLHAIAQSNGALGSATTVASSIRNFTTEPTGQFVYTWSSSNSTLTVHTINTSSGALTSVSTASAPPNSSIGMAVAGIPQ